MDDDTSLKKGDTWQKGFSNVTCDKNIYDTLDDSKKIEQSKL